MNKRRRIGLILLICLVTGCASSTGFSLNRNDDPASRARNTNYGNTDESDFLTIDAMVAIDLVSAIMQLPDYAPFYTTVQFSPLKTPFGKAVLKAMTRSGFGIQLVPEDQGINYVSYATRQVTSEGGETMEYSVKIKDLEVQRQYQIDGTSIFPLTEIVVSGVQPSRVLVNDDIYKVNARGETFPTGVSFRDSDGMVVDQQTSVTRVSNAAGRVTGESISNEQYLVLARASIFTVDRLHGRGSTAYRKEDFIANKQLTVRFRPNNMTLGDANKLGIRKMLTAFQEERDIYTITGCSHGRSLMFDGTEQMALLRSQRIKEELLSYGVKHDNLREEGCFQTEYGETLPPNGVIITHKRRLATRS